MHTLQLSMEVGIAKACPGQRLWLCELVAYRPSQYNVLLLQVYGIGMAYWPQRHVGTCQQESVETTHLHVQLRGVLVALCNATLLAVVCDVCVRATCCVKHGKSLWHMWSLIPCDQLCCQW